MAGKVMRTIYVSEEMDKEIEEYAKELGISYTGVVRILLMDKDIGKIKEVIANEWF